MKSLIKASAFAGLLLTLPVVSEAASTPSIGVVQLKECAEASKLGKREQENFEKFKNKFQQELVKKQGELKDVQAKLEDSDYLDSLSPEAERDLKLKIRRLAQEFTQLQQYFYQSLQQAFMQSQQTITVGVAESARSVAEREGLDVVLNADSCFYLAEKYDVTANVIENMDEVYAARELEDPTLSEAPEVTIPDFSSMPLPDLTSEE